MLNFLRIVLTAAFASLKSRRGLALENLALRQQLEVLERRTGRPKLTWVDRAFWVALSRWWTDWRQALMLVKPATVIAWHRKGFALYWSRKSRQGPGRPRVNPEIRTLIRRMAKDNIGWGAPRIHGELLRLGLTVSEATVSRHMPRPRAKPPFQTWRTFLRNHMHCAVGIDFFVVPTATFRLLYVFVILDHARRRIVHVNVTEHPCARWTAQQVIEAFSYDSSPRYLHRDRDSTYGSYFSARVRAMGIEQVISASRAPWQNPFAERVIGSIRRECTDHLIITGERHLRQLLRMYVDYYKTDRTHDSLGKDAPDSRAAQRRGNGAVVALPRVGGLHHRYERRAARSFDDRQRSELWNFSAAAPVVAVRARCTSSAGSLRGRSFGRQIWRAPYRTPWSVSNVVMTRAS